MIKKILLGFIVVVLVVGSIIMASSIRDAKQEDLLKEEVKSVMALFRSSDFDQEKMDELLERTVSKKDYEVVEKAFKAYIKDYLYDLNYYK